MSDIPCGATRNIRSTTLASLVCYETAATHAGSDEVRFQAPTIIATTHGEWQFRSGAERERIDIRSLVLGNEGDSYACRHACSPANKGFVVYLKPGAVEAGLVLFDKKVIGARKTLRLLVRSLGASTDDEFDSVVFSMFSEASSLSWSDQNVAARLRIERAKRFIERHAFEPITLRDVANELGFTPFTTIRQFRAATGKTPHSYMLDLRLGAAKQLLRETRASVESIANSVGFDDFAYFSRFFKRRTGQTPSEYRAA